MKLLQGYIFRQTLAPLIVILCGLAVVAVLTQGLSQLGIIVDQRQSALAFLWVTVLSIPLLIALIMPLAVFFAVTYAVNRMHSENEIAVAFAAGTSRWQIASPIMKVAWIAALLHLSVAVVVQPASYREMRRTMADLKADFAAALIREGDFTTPAKGLTFYARHVGAGAVLSDVFVNDSRNPAKPTTYTARSGLIVTVKDKPALMLRDGQIQWEGQNGAVNLVDFDQYPLELQGFSAADEEYQLKPSDRYLSELFFPNKTHFYDQRNVDRFLAEAHYRLSGVLLNPALALIALAGLLGGDFSRQGYGRRIAISALAALVVRVMALAIQSACVDTPALNLLQYLFPIGVSLLALRLLLKRGGRVRRRVEAGPTLAMANS